MTHSFTFILILVTTTFGATKAEGRDRCFRQVSDVVIAIDSSFSIRSKEFQMQLLFLKNLIDSFSIGKNNMQVGVVSFGSKVRMEIALNRFQSKSALKRAVGRIKHMNSGTYTNEAIRFVHSQMFDEDHGGRPWAKRKMVLITDGFASNLKKTLLEASKARLKGVEIFSIGVGGRTNGVELRGMASEPKRDHVFQVKNYDSLSHIKAALTDATCERPLNDAAHTLPPFSQSLKECKQNAADIFFLMDSSSSIWPPDFYKYIRFVRQVSSTFTLGQDAVRVGLIVYSDRPKQLLSLLDTQTESHLNRVLDHTKYMSGGSNTAWAIEHARKYGFTRYNKRSRCARIMVILTDGESNDQKSTIKEARLAHGKGIRIFAIGVGEKTDSQELMAVASDPDDKFVFHVDDFGRLNTIKDLLVVKTCDAVKEAVVNDAPAKPKQCPSLSTDVVFIYDTTSLSLHYHNIVINTISDVIATDSLISNNLRFGVIREASKTARKLRDIKLTDDWKKTDFKTKLNPESERSSAQLLLRKARRLWDDEWSHKNTRIVFLFLESDLKNIIGASLESSLLKHSGVRIVVIGLGRHFNSNQALYLASHPVKQNLIIHKQEHNGDNGDELVTKLISKLCQKMKKVSSPT